MPCKKCGEKDPGKFYPYQMGECKECTRTRVRANRRANIEHYREFDRHRSGRADRMRASAEKNRRKAKATPGYDAAHCAVARAVKSGRLIRPATCERCPATEKVQAHHDDHTKPLEVMWLCPVCHAERHAELGRLRTAAAIYGKDPPLGF